VSGPRAAISSRLWIGDGAQGRAHAPSTPARKWFNASGERPSLTAGVVKEVAAFGVPRASGCQVGAVPVSWGRALGRRKPSTLPAKGLAIACAFSPGRGRAVGGDQHRRRSS